MLDGLPVFCDEEFASLLLERRGELSKTVGGWTITLYADSPELWISSDSLVVVIYYEEVDYAMYCIDSTFATREQIIDITFNSQDAELQNFFLFNELL